MISDWTITGTIAYLQNEFRAFRFIGEGWYKAKSDTLYCERLADPSPKQMHGSDPHNEFYQLHVWNGRDPRVEWRRLMEMPTR
jgi:hypothetical protein